jgi:enediyne biosynthesis protein E4
MKLTNVYSKFIISCCLIFLLLSCNRKEKNTLFTSLPAAVSGVAFNNQLHDDDSSYSFINEFGYMGAGVAIGDFNNDGLKDIFFSGNQVSCKIYINKGNNQFDDISDKAGINTSVWCTGVSITDINQDGYDDIYVCVFGKDLAQRSKNLLFINQHDLTFKEAADDYGLADLGYSTQAAFFDYDKDGDLDMYLANYLLSKKNANTIFPRDNSGFSPANDRLYRNNGDSLNAGHPVFSDVSMQVGIKEDGYGLGLSVSDYNNDGWPDIYVANDFVSNDILWLNNKNGTFSNCINSSLKHQSYSSMGADAADLNNDALTDIVTLDMLPEYNERKKTSFSFMNYERYEAERNMGYEPEFMRNMLQLNNGNRVAGDNSIPFFSETGRLSGIQATDWSWSVLLADFNNDGWKDMHITNGIGRDFINADFLEFSSNIFSGPQSPEEKQNAIRKKLASLQNVNLPNYLFINNHDLTFSNYAAAGGVDEPSMSNGAAYADLDNDGDLDLVVNNINKAAFILINNTNQKSKPVTEHFLKLQLTGTGFNKKGFGSKISIFNNGMEQVQEQNPVRGYFSSVDQELLFGLGKNNHVDSLLVIWPDGKRQSLKNIKADTTLSLSWNNASVVNNNNTLQAFLFQEIPDADGIFYRHQENNFNDYNLQRLIPQKYSQLGPFITTGDINNDGATDFFIGGAFNFSGKLFTQKNGKTFTSKNLSDTVKFEEDMDCILFDADKDGDSDLLVTCGDIQYEENSIHYKPRLYSNDGHGNFQLQPLAIPDSVRTIAGCVSAGDYDADGDLDLFIGGRVSKTYPLPARSFILKNSRGIFTDVTAAVCPALQKPGMVTAAVWTDFDNDKQTDLIVAGEWMPLQFFKNNAGQLVDATTSTGLTQTNGMWRSLIETDMDNDGDMDLVAGNLGLNCEYQANSTEPMELFAKDIDGNGSIDPLFFYYIKSSDGNKHSFPAIGRNRLTEQVPSLKKQFLFNENYSHAGYQDIFKGKTTDNMMHLSCTETRTCYFENTGKGNFIKHPLPQEAQFSPVNVIVCDDFNNDGYKDLLLAGNEYQAEVMTGIYDASYGCFLLGNIKNSFTPVSPAKSGFIINGDVRDMALIHLPGGTKLLLAAVNNDLLRVFRIKADNKIKKYNSSKM